MIGTFNVASASFSAYGRPGKIVWGCEETIEIKTYSKKQLSAKNGLSLGRLQAQQLQLVAEEPKVKGGVVGDEGGRSNPLQELGEDLSNGGGGGE
jgi:hypothetical protein